ncbi:amidohydrolase [Rhizobium mongolense]|uniref:amidohydrolase family protein n=1 Tax=Rhizobium TaxID=379 RepID=UPI0024B1DFAF|nr:amidohydrolase family protein [Rhizobium sp. CC1099]WFU91797.1 amidohydrolase family protein [Rhizobium sp. CC1099]
MRRVDCHMHFWTLAMEPYYSLWMSPDDKVLYRDYGPRDAVPLMEKNNVEGVVVVSAASSVHETGYLLGLADGRDFIKGVVAWLDLLAPTAADDLGNWARFAKLKSIRPYLQDLPEEDWILKKELDPAFRAMLDHGLRFDALIKPRHILNTVRFIERYPDLPVIVDHMAKPEIGSGNFEPWRRDMERFRDLDHVHCKISGIVTEDGPDWTPERLQPYLETVFDIFGPDRLVFGSDWPVVNLVADYSRWIETLDHAMKSLPAADQQKIWASNGERFYGL